MKLSFEPKPRSNPLANLRCLTPNSILRLPEFKPGPLEVKEFTWDGKKLNNAPLGRGSLPETSIACCPQPISQGPVSPHEK